MSKTKKPLSRNRSRSVGTTCDWKSGLSKAKKSSEKSVICKHRGNYKWRGIKTETYKLKKDNWNKIIRRVLIGNGLKTKSHLRYFEIAPEGQSSFEKHGHEHIVIGISGQGKVRLENMLYKVGFLDVVYVSPNTPHQFLNPNAGPFGFICVVPSKRDKPRLLQVL